MFFKQRLYIQISPDRITLSMPTHWCAFDAPPLVAIEHSADKVSIVALGADAQSFKDRPGMHVVNPFGHPRTIISDFTVASKLIEHAIDAALPRRWLRPRMETVIHPRGEFEGGLTQVEYRALCELAAVSGARRIGIHEGRQLTRAELLAFDFVKNGA